VVHAVDSSAAMIERLRILLAESSDEGCPVELHESDLQAVEIRDASFVVLNLTLQFVAAERRAAVIQQIYDGLLPGGALLLSEKLCFEDSQQQALLTELHHDFKRANGYSDLEIAQKRTAIENRLIPETMETHVQRLKQAGFTTVAPWFQCFNFASILAVR
jgi:tRNA (cmo5U34)-methyltransferase